MQGYRRNLVPGGTFFFTVNLLDRSSHLLVDEIGTLREAVRLARARMAFHIDAWVVLPDHMHCVWTLPVGDADYPARWRMIKAGFSGSLDGRESVCASRAAKGERGIWQRRHWEHMVHDDRDYAAHLDYVHFNPVNHGRAACLRDWPYSSFHYWVRRGVYAADWGTAVDVGVAGERD